MTIQNKKIKSNLLNSDVKDYSIETSSISTIFNNMADSGGFESRNLSDGVNILLRMQNESKCTKFLSFVGALISTGARGIIRDMLRKKMFDCVITTCGALDHEIADHIGSMLDESSFLYWAHKNNIPVIVPGIVDGAVGSQIWFFSQHHKDFKINILSDETMLSDLVYEAKKSGAFIIGGGISKHHTLWWNQFRGGLDYTVYITTGPEWDGSLSGAPIAEAISWSKVRTRAKQTTIHGEATIMLPFMYAALLEAKKN